LIGGVKERPIAFKLGLGFCDHNHERKEALAGFQGMVNFAREVHRTVMSPVWKLTPRGAARLRRHSPAGARKEREEKT
jgi:nitrogenase molybdenum-cofactor synthesis protein NifE